MLLPKSIISVILILSLISCHAQLKSIWQKVDRFEILGGPSLISQHGLKYTQYNRSKAGFTVGIGAHWDIQEKISLTSKLLYEQKGIHRSYDVFYHDENLNRHSGQRDEIQNLYYLTVPVNVRYSFGSDKNFFVESGPYFSYLLKAQAITKLSWLGTGVYDAQEHYTDFDVGASTNIGYQTTLTKKPLISFWINATYGLIDVSKDTSPAYKVSKNHSVAIGVSIMTKKN